MGFHCHNNKDHYRNTLHAPCRLEDRLGWVKVDYDRLVCLCLSALGGRSSTDIILQIDIHLSPLCSGSRRDISSCQHRWLFIPFCRHIDIFQTEARKKKNKKQKLSFFPSAVCVSIQCIFFPWLCWMWNEAEQKDVGQTAVKWRPGPWRSVQACECVSVHVSLFGKHPPVRCRCV